MGLDSRHLLSNTNPVNTRTSKFLCLLTSFSHFILSSVRGSPRFWEDSLDGFFLDRFCSFILSFFLFLFFYFCKMHEFFFSIDELFSKLRFASKLMIVFQNWWTRLKFGKFYWKLMNFFQIRWTFFNSMYIFWNRWAFFKIDEIFHIGEIFVQFIKVSQIYVFLFLLTFPKSMNFF